MSEKHIGKVIQVIGPVLDIQFKDGELPELLNAIEIDNHGQKLVVEVAQLTGDNVARCIAMSSTDGLVRGTDAEVSGQGAYLIAVAHMTKRYDFVASVDYLKTGMGPGSLLTSTLGVQHWLSKLSRWQLEYRLVAPQGEGHGPMEHHIRMQFQFGF